MIKFFWVILMTMTMSLAGESVWVKYGNQVFLGAGDAVSIALSEANIATAGGPLSIIWNPAQLNIDSVKSISFSHQERFSGIVSFDVFGLHLKDSYKYKRGLVLIRESVQGIPNTTRALLYDSGSLDDPNERILGSKVTYFNQVQWAGILSYAGRKGDWLIGGSVKGIIHQLGSHTGYGVGFDAGAIRRLMPGNTMAVVVRDASSSWVVWESGSIERIAPEVSAGDVHTLTIEPLNLKIQLMGTVNVSVMGKDNSSDFSMGPFSGSLRLGIDTQYKERFHLRLGRNPISDYSFGLGLNFPFGHLDYAFTPSPMGSILGNSHYVTLNVTLQFLSSLPEKLGN